MRGTDRCALAAFKKHAIERVLIAYDRDAAGDAAAAELAPRLMQEGIECYRIEFPKGMDANEYALKVRMSAPPSSMWVAHAWRKRWRRRAWALRSARRYGWARAKRQCARARWRPSRRWCEHDGTTPEVVLRGFIADLCGIVSWARTPRGDSYCSNGSDEREFARAYYERVDYPYWKR